MSTISPSKKLKFQSSQNKIQSIENQKLIEQQHQRLVRNQQRVVQLQQKLNKLKQERAKKMHELDSVDHKQMLPLIKQLREHYKKLKQQLGSQFYYEQDQVDVDQMSYEQLLQLGEKIGKVSKGLTQQQFQKLEKVISTSSDNCLICQESIVIGSQCIKLKCGHIYDIDCLKQWFKMQKVCPLCKSQSI